MQEFILGITISSLMALIVFLTAHQAPLSECAQKHDVFACEWVAQPTTTED